MRGRRRVRGVRVWMRVRVRRSRRLRRGGRRGGIEEVDDGGLRLSIWEAKEHWG